MRSWLSISLRAPRSTIAAIALVTAVLAVFAARIRIDSAIENLLPDGDPGAPTTDVRTVFGNERRRSSACSATSSRRPRWRRSIGYRRGWRRSTACARW
jgi:hypothetical protein